MVHIIALAIGLSLTLKSGENRNKDSLIKVILIDITLMPSPYQVKTVPRLKAIRNIFRFVQNPIPLINETIEELGPSYRVHLGGINRSLMTRDPVVIQHVLQKNHKNYYKSKIQTEALAKYAGYGLLTTDGDYWLRQRRLIQPGFHKQKLKSLVNRMNEVLVHHVQQLQEKILTGDTTVELTKDMVNLTLKVVSKALFSSGINEDQLGILGHAVTTSQVAVIKDIRQPMFKWWRNLTGEQKSYYESVNKGRDLLLSLIEGRKDSGESLDDLLDMLLEARYEDTGEAMTTKQILDEILIIFAAGHETTALAMTWTLYLLDKHPDILEQLRKEIDSVELSPNPGFEDILKLPYCKQVISETMRLYPPAWITDRIALEDDEVDGIKIEKGEIIGVYIYGVHHSPEIWESPERFDPNRFAADKQKQISAYSYFPFGGGPRLCIGQQFAWTEMILALYHLVKNFDFTLTKDHKVEIEPMITLRPRFGMSMEFSKRSEL